MGNIDTSMGYVVNNDGSITRINSTQHQSSRSPNFIPMSLSKLTSSRNFLIFYLVLCTILFNFLGILFFGENADRFNSNMNDYYHSYILSKSQHDEEKAKYYFSYYERYMTDRNFCFGCLVVLIVGSIAFDSWAVIRIRKKYPKKETIRKGIEYIQSNLRSNYSHPYIMTNNLIGVFSMRKGKIIIPPNYDDIRWVIPKKVFCAERQGKKMFYDINGDILNNVPQSYYNS